MNRGQMPVVGDHIPDAAAEKPVSGQRLRHRIMRGGGLLGMAEGTSLLLRFARSIILARLLTPADFGVAATFLMTIQFLEMLSDLGADKLLVQCREEEAERLQRVSQSLAVVRGLIIGLVIFLLAGVLARMFRAPEAVAGFRLLAVVPVVRGFCHQDIVRMQREMRFGPWVFTQIASGTVATLLAWPLAIYFRDWRSLLGMLVMDSLLVLALSHLLAERRYRWGLEGGELSRLVQFGWPLLINGLLVFGIFQGDRFIVATWYGMTELGLYSVAFMVAILPVGVSSRIGELLLLPVFSNLRAESARLDRAYRLTQQVVSFGAAALSIMWIVAGPAIVVLLYGRKYQSAAILVGWLGIAHAVRLLRLVPTLGVLAYADSRNPLIANIVRTTALPLAAGAAACGGDLRLIAAATLVGETLAFVSAVLGAHRRHGLSWSAVVYPSLCYGTAVAACVLVKEVLVPANGVAIGLITGTGFVFLLAAIMLAGFGEARSLVCPRRV